MLRERENATSQEYDPGPPVVDETFSLDLPDFLGEVPVNTDPYLLEKFHVALSRLQPHCRGHITYSIALLNVDL